MAGSLSRDLMQSPRTDCWWDTKKYYWSQNHQDIEGVSIGKKYQQRNVFTFSRDNNKKISRKLVKFQKWSFEISFQKLIFSAKSFKETCGEIQF